MPPLSRPDVLNLLRSLLRTSNKPSEAYTSWLAREGYRQMLYLRSFQVRDDMNVDKSTVRKRKDSARVLDLSARIGKHNTSVLARDSNQ